MGASSSERVASFMSMVQMFIEPNTTNLVIRYSSNAPGVDFSVPVRGVVAKKTPNLILLKTKSGLVQFESPTEIGLGPGPLPGVLRLTIMRGLNGRRVMTQTCALGSSPLSSPDVSFKHQADYQAQLLKSDIEIDGPQEDQQAIRSELYRLRTAFKGAKGDLMAPFGLTSPLYFGHKFWDMDLWIAPSLALIDPEVITAAANYRADHLAGARANFAKWKLEHKVTGPTHPSAAKIPWESSVTGEETVLGFGRDEDHIGMSALWGAKLASAVGDFNRLPQLYEGVSEFLKVRRTKTERGFEIKHTVSPDENFTGDNDLYTNILAQWVANKMTWEQGAEKYYLPKDKVSFLTYDGDRLKGYKQAAAILSLFPLQFPAAEAEAHQLITRFGGKSTENGPAMSDSVEATIWARLGDKDRAYEAWQKSWDPFMKDPLLQFSEKRKSNRTYFYTGAAGNLSAVIYGFIGCRIDTKPLADASWKTPLKNGMWLSIKPNLPIGWRSVKFKGMNVLGKRYTVFASRKKDGSETVQVTPEK